LRFHILRSRKGVDQRAAWKGIDHVSPVQIVTDSSACLPPEGSSSQGLHVVPIVVHLGGSDVRGDAGVPAARVFQALARDEPVKSSAPSVMEYLAAIESSGAHDVLVVTPATELTVMYRNACLAADLAEARVRVLDSRTAAAAQGLVVETALRLARTGATLEEVEREAAEAARRVDLVAALDGLRHIRRSGRVPSVALGLAEQLGVRPVFRMSEGGIERLALPRSEPAALRRIVHEATRRGLSDAARVAVFHAAAPERARTLVDLVGRADHVTEFSPAMALHTGPGVVGVAWLRS
jgi:DegV family protein with EDD domain